MGDVGLAQVMDGDGEVAGVLSALDIVLGAQVPKANALPRSLFFRKGVVTQVQRALPPKKALTRGDPVQKANLPRVLFKGTLSSTLQSASMLSCPS